MDYPFIDDPNVLGTWKSVDFVATPEDFVPGRRQWPESGLFLKELVFLPNGKTPRPRIVWTKDLVIDPLEKTAARYIIREIGGQTYMFFEWKSGDYTMRGRKPSYYVLKKEP